MGVHIPETEKRREKGLTHSAMSPPRESSPGGSLRHRRNPAENLIRTLAMNLAFFVLKTM
jgi:hypothetical protein